MTVKSDHLTWPREGNQSLRYRSQLGDESPDLYGKANANSKNSFLIRRGHDYSDHCHDSEVKMMKEETTLNGLHIASIKPRRGISNTFPKQLHEMLTKASIEMFDNIVSWQPHGRSFVVHDRKRFVAEVMHRFFQQTKLSSFQRQLNLYGFSRQSVGPDRGGYYHELFLRGRPGLCNRMLRTRIKGMGVRAVPVMSTEPNFYSMEFCLENYTVKDSEDDKTLAIQATQSYDTSWCATYLSLVTTGAFQDRVSMNPQTHEPGDSKLPPLHKIVGASDSTLVNLNSETNTASHSAPLHLPQVCNKVCDEFDHAFLCLTGDEMAVDGTTNAPVYHLEDHLETSGCCQEDLSQLQQSLSNESYLEMQNSLFEAAQGHVSDEDLQAFLQSITWS